MNRDSSIHAKSIHGVVSTGDNAHINQTYKENISHEFDICDEIMEIFERLSLTYPNASSEQRKIVFQMEVQKKISEDSSFKKRLANALKYGAIELTKVITNNPFISVPLETVRGWIEVQN